MTLNLKIDASTEQNALLWKKWSCPIFNKLVWNVRLKAMIQLVDKRILIALVLMEFATIVTLSLKQWVVISTTVHVKKFARHWLTTKLWEGKKRECYAQRIYLTKRIQKYRNVGVQLVGINRTDVTVKNHLRANFPYELLLSEEGLLQEVKSGKSFGYVKCDLKNPEHLKTYFANFPPIFKNTVVGWNDIGTLMKEYAEKEGILSQLRKMLISSFNLKNGTIIIPFFLFYLHLGLDCTIIHQIVQYTPKKCLKSFLQSAVKARRQRDENTNSSVVAETMKFLANICYGYQIMDRSWHTVTKNVNDGKTHNAITIKLFKWLKFNTDQLYEVELVKSEIEHRKPVIVVFFRLQYTKLRTLELYYKLFKKFCVTEIYEELEMDTDSLYLSLAEENLEDNILLQRN